MESSKKAGMRKAMWAKLTKAKKTNLLGNYSVKNPNFKAKQLHVRVSTRPNTYLPIEFHTDGKPEKHHRMSIDGMENILKLAKAKKIS